MNNIIICIIICIIVILLYIFNLSRNESFFVAYNEFEVQVPLNEEESDVKNLNTLFEEYNTLKAEGTNKFPSTESYQLFPYYSKFSLEKIFGDTLINTLNLIFLKKETYKNDKIQIVKNVYDLYTKDDGKNENYIFKIDLKNLDKKWVLTFQIFLVFKDVNDYVNPLTGEIFINKKDQPLPIEIKYIEPLTYVVEGILGRTELSNDSYYRIKNTLHLMDPFLTSNKEMVIDKNMRIEFGKKLKK